MSSRDDRRQVVRGCVILLTLIACAFSWIAIISFDAGDWPNPHRYPHPDPASNAAGRAGAWVAYHVFVYLGRGAYAALAGLTVAIGVLARQGRLLYLWQRVLGIILLVSVVSTAAHLLTVSDPPLWPELRGGVLGFFLANWLQQSVKWMTVPILLYALLVGVLFTAEGLVMRIPKAIWGGREQIQNLAEEVRQRAVKPSWLSRLLRPLARLAAVLPLGRPALAGAGAGGGRGLNVKINPGRLAGAPARGTSAGGQEASTSSEKDSETGADQGEATAVAVADDEEQAGEGAGWKDGAESDLREKGAYDDEEEDEEEYEDDDEEEDDEDEDDEEEDKEDEGEDEEYPEEEDAAAAGEGKSAPKMIVRFAQPARPADTPASSPPRPYPTELREWEFPPVGLLEEPEYTFTSQHEAQVRDKAKTLEQTLAEYKIEAHVVEIDTGPVITMFEVAVAPGVKVSQISTLANDIARALKAPSVRVVAPIPGKNTIGIEVPNIDKEKVRIKELMRLSAGAMQEMALPLYLGKDANGNALVADLTKAPHMLIAGTTGSGKSVCINSIIVSLLMTQRPDLVKLILVDPKMVEMTMFRDVPHLMCPIVNEMERAEKILEWATVKMDERYALLSEAGVRNISAYNRLSKQEKRERFQPSTPEEETQIPQHLPYIVILIDELADMMMMSAKEVELHLSRLAQKSRAVGVHIIVATQRPEAKIVTGLIKSNLPCRIAFRVASRMDSRIVLDQNGAEVLMGQGDMLYLPPGSSKLVRAQGTFVEDSELKAVINFLKDRGKPEFHPELMQLRSQEFTTDGPRDELFEKAVEIILETKRGSVSLLQRRLMIGYSRASRLIEEMAAAGVVGEYKGSQAREVAITREQWEAMKLQEAERIRQAALSGDGGVPDDMFDDDIN